jgi:UDP-N-acetylmuramate dehydrogenase
MSETTMSMNSSQRAVLTGVVRGKIQWDAPLSAWTTFRIGGPADALVTLLDVDGLQEVLRFCRRQALPWKLVGRGSNILAADEGFRGIVIVLGEGFNYIACHGQPGAGEGGVEVGAAVGLTRLSSWTAERGLSGFEFASGIPGSIGGAIAMNAGAWGRSMSDVIDKIELVDHEKIEIISNRNCGFGYRVCRALEHRSEPAVVCGARLGLTSMPVEQVKQTIRTLTRKRRERQPQRVASAGSVFRNPPGASAGQLIEAAGLKGRRVGAAEISEVHANFIVNRGNATARDVLTLMDVVQEEVFRTSGIELTAEVELLGCAGNRPTGNHAVPKPQNPELS